MNLKLTIEDTLQKIDNFFREKSKKDTYYIYIMVIALVGSMAYPFYDMSVKKLLSAQKRVEFVQGKLKIDKEYLQKNPEVTIVKLNQNIKKLNTELKISKENNQYIKSKIDTISALVYDEQAWGEYINSISINAKRYNIKILNFTNEYSKNDKAFGHILDINIDLRGNYANTLKFINSLEKSDLVVDVHNLSIKAEDALNTKLSISVWGITY